MIVCEECHTELALEVGALLANGSVTYEERDVLLSKIERAASVFHAAIPNDRAEDYPASMQMYASVIFIAGLEPTPEIAGKCMIDDAPKAQSSLF